MFKTLIRLAVLAGIGMAARSAQRRLAGRASEPTSAGKPAEQVWEGEGGALPQSGSQLGPAPTSNDTFNTSNTSSY
jgi:hypothetical protein